VKTIAEYLEHALHFEEMAAGEADGSALKESFLKQALAYRKLAAERAARLNFVHRPADSKPRPRP
jgi:hypothetical protein